MRGGEGGWIVYSQNKRYYECFLYVGMIPIAESSVSLPVCRKHVAFIFTFTVLDHHNVMKNKGEKMEKKLKRINRARSELLAFGKFRKKREPLLPSSTKNRNRRTGNLYYQQGVSEMIAFENDLDYRKILEVYDACFQDLHDNYLLKGKLYIMETLLSGFIQAGLQVEKVGYYIDHEFYEDTGEGFLLVEKRFLVGTAFLERLSESDILGYLHDREWTDIDVVLLSVESEKPAWFALDKSKCWPASWSDILCERVPDLDEPDEYWLYMEDPEPYEHLGEEEEDDYEGAKAFSQDQPIAPELETKSEPEKTDPCQNDRSS